MNIMVYYLVVIFDVGCKSDFVILLISFDVQKLKYIINNKLKQYIFFKILFFMVDNLYKMFF